MDEYDEKNPSQDAMSAGQETCVDFVMQPAMKQKELIWERKREGLRSPQVCHKRRIDLVLQHSGRETGSDRRDRCGTVLLRKGFRLSKN